VWSRRKSCVSGAAPILEGGNTRFWKHVFKSHSFLSIGQLWLSSVQRGQRIADEKKIEERIAVKPKSADDYVGRPSIAAFEMTVYRRMRCVTQRQHRSNETIIELTPSDRILVEVQGQKLQYFGHSALFRLFFFGIRQFCHAENRPQNKQFSSLNY